MAYVTEAAIAASQHLLVYLDTYRSRTIVWGGAGVGTVLAGRLQRDRGTGGVLIA